MRFMLQQLKYKENKKAGGGGGGGEKKEKKLSMEH